MGFVQLGARRNHAQKMETKFLTVNRMLFVSSLELTLPVLFFNSNFVTNRRQCSPEFAVAWYIDTLFRKFSYFSWKNGASLSEINQCLFSEFNVSSSYWLDHGNFYAPWMKFRKLWTCKCSILICNLEFGCLLFLRSSVVVANLNTINHYNSACLAQLYVNLIIVTERCCWHHTVLWGKPELWKTIIFRENPRVCMHWRWKSMDMKSNHLIISNFWA